MTRLLEPRLAALSLALVSAVALIAAFGLQYLAGLAPCPLCVWQRYPHLAVIALGLVGWYWRAPAMIGLAALVLVGSTGLAAYHVGVEQGWLALPAGCAAGAGAGSVEELRRMLAEAPPTCDQVSFTLFGLSLAGWNLVLSLGLTVWAVLALTSNRRHPRRIGTKERFEEGSPATR
jgi:disulfide bond formation protein DsbB